MRFIILSLILLFLGCSSKAPKRYHITNTSHPPTSYEGEKILRMGEIMALRDREIIRGSCWDYIDTLYTRAGFPRNKRGYIFKTRKNSPPYAPLSIIKPGDWLYFINHSYGKVEHSGIFVRWQNRSKTQAVILSYGGENRRKPGRYLIYNIRDTFTILRAKN